MVAFDPNNFYRKLDECDVEEVKRTAADLYSKEYSDPWQIIDDLWQKINEEPDIDSEVFVILQSLQY